MVLHVRPHYLGYLRDSYYGDRVSIKVEGLPLPTLDLFENRLVKGDPKVPEQRIFATFPGVDGPIVVLASHDPMEGALSFEVPKLAIDGPVSIQFAVKEHLGSWNLMDKLDPSDDILRAAIARHVPNRKAIERCGVNACISQDDIGKHETILRPCQEDENDPWLEQRIERSELSVVSNLVLYLRCFPSAIRYCPLCPNNAIELDDSGNCFVNADNCLGQSCRINGYVVEDGDYHREVQNDNFVRGEESVCWECFEVGDGARSSKCFKHKLRKVLHINTRPCCGSCHYKSQFDGDTLADLCSVGAVSAATHSYIVDKDACVGCMICYENINCYKNISEDRREHAIRMIAYLG